MAENDGHALRVGIVIVIGIAILAVAIFSIGGGLRWLGGSQELIVRFKRVNGLQVGAPVYLSGVNIGSVSSIQFPQDRRANYVVVRLRIAANAAQRVRTDSVAKIESLGLLGDKFLLLTAGSDGAPSAEPGSLMKAQDPVNYAALLQARGTGDLVANVIAISNGMRQLLDSINQGNGILAELIRGSSNPNEKAFTLKSIRQTMDNVQQLTQRLDLTVDRIERGQGIVGALLSPKTDGQRVVANIASSSESLRLTSQRLEQTSLEFHDLVARMDNANGLLPRLMLDTRYAGEVMDNLRHSSADMRDALDKIDSRRGTLGLLINDPSLYNKADNLVSANGWAFSLLRGAYSVTHPFGTTASPSSAPPSNGALNYTPENGSAPPLPSAPSVR